MGKATAVEIAETVSTPFFSIIVPFFRAIDFIALFLASLYVPEAIGLFELIIVTDYDDPATKAKLKELASQYCPVPILCDNRMTKGPFGARVTGQSIARGKYWLFADADDIVYGNTLPQLMEFLLKSESDVAFFNVVFGSGEPYKPFSGHCVDSQQAIFKLLTDCVHAALWNKCIKSSSQAGFNYACTEGLNGIQFGEDFYHCFLLYQSARTFTHSDLVVYKHIDNPNGCSHSTHITAEGNKLALDLYYRAFVETEHMLSMEARRRASYLKLSSIVEMLPQYGRYPYLEYRQ